MFHEICYIVQGEAVSPVHERDSVSSRKWNFGVAWITPIPQAIHPCISLEYKVSAEKPSKFRVFKLKVTAAQESSFRCFYTQVPLKQMYKYVLMLIYSSCTTWIKLMKWKIFVLTRLRLDLYTIKTALLWPFLDIGRKHRVAD